MKFIHLSDLHLGKRVNEFSMLEEQDYILGKIIEIIRDEWPDALLIAGDVYDKPVPPVEAVKLFDRFLSALSGTGVKVLVISGNHDSPERLSFASGLLGGSGVFISPAYGGEVSSVTFTDEWGKVNFYMLPFIKPAHVARWFPDEDIQSYTSAVRGALAHTPINFNGRNVLLTHQFVTGAERSESEEISVGGADNVDGSVFEGFDYVALGHIHGPQSIGKPTVRYCGTPLKYSFSEASHKKSVTVVQMGQKGDVEVRTVPLTPRRDWVQLRGDFMRITSKQTLEKLNPDDYYKITLTDEEDVPEGVSKLRRCFPNLMAMEYDNSRTRAAAEVGEAGDVTNKTPIQLFSELFEKQNGKPMTDEMCKVVGDMIEKIWQGENS